MLILVKFSETEFKTKERKNSMKARSFSLRSLSLYLLLFVLLLAFLPSILKSQHRLGLGVYIGAPTGITGKYLVSYSNSVDALFGWQFGNSFHMQGHYNFNLLDERYKSGVFHIYVGPGLFFRAVSKRTDSFGASGNLGVAYFLKRRFEFFFEVSPKLVFYPGSEFDLTGGLGFRFYF